MDVCRCDVNIPLKINSIEAGCKRMGDGRCGMGMPAYHSRSQRLAGKTYRPIPTRHGRTVVMQIAQKQALLVADITARCTDCAQPQNAASSRLCTRRVFCLAKVARPWANQVTDASSSVYTTANKAQPFHNPTAVHVLQLIITSYDILARAVGTRAVHRSSE